MADEQSRVLVDVEIKNDKALKALTDLKNQAEKLKAEQKELGKRTEENAEEYDRLTQQIAGVNAQARQYQTEIQNNLREQNANTGSLKEMRVQLSQLTAEYVNMDGEMREGEDGQALAARIKDLSDALKDAEGGIGDFRRNVGDYENAMKSAFSTGVPFVDNLVKMGMAGGSAGGAFKAMTTAAMGFGKALLALAKNPIILIITALVLILMKLRDVVKGNEEIMAKFKAITAALDPIIGGITKAFEFLADAIASVIGWFVEATVALGEWITGTEKGTSAISKAIQAEKDRAQLIRDTRAANEAAALTDQKVAELRAKIAQKDQYNAEERLKMLDEVLALEKQKAETEKQLAAERLRLLEAEAKQGKMSTEMENKLSEARIALIVATTNLSKTEKELNGQRASFLQEEQNAIKASADAGKKAADEALKRLQDLARADVESYTARLEAEEDFLSSKLEKQQEYANKIYTANEKAEQENLRLLLQYGKIKQKEYDRQLENLLNARKKFNNEQAKAANDYQKQQRAALSAMIEQSTELQIENVIKKYDDAVKALGELVIPVRIGQTDEEFAAELKEYERLTLESNGAIVQLEKQKQAEIEKIQADALQKRSDLIKNEISKQYESELIQHTENEFKKVEISISMLKDEIAARKAAGLETYQQEASLRAEQLKAEQLNLDKRLLYADKNAREIFEARKAFLEAEAEIYKEDTDRKIELMQQMRDLELEYLQERTAAFSEYANSTLSVASEISNVMNQLGAADVQQYTADNAAKKKELDQRLKQGAISEEQHAAATAKLDADLDKKKAQIAREQAKREKVMKVFEITINTIAAAVAALPNVLLSALIGAMGAASLAAVIATPLPKAAKGRLITGKSHTQGGEIIEAEAGEVIINKKSAKKYMPLLSMINEAGGGVPFAKPFSDGGFAARGAVAGGGDTDTTQSITDAIIAGLRALNIFVTVEDIRRADEQYAEVIDRANF